MGSFRDQQIYDRLNDRLEFAQQTKDMPHRTIWLRMESQSVKARAQTFVDKIRDDEKLRREFYMVNDRLSDTKRGSLSTQAFEEEVAKILSRK
jgi:lipoprotein NlpI